RVTCMACFREVKVTVLPTDASTFCPKCRSPIELVAQPDPNAPTPSANQAAFEKLESKKDFKKRMQAKVAAAQASAASDAAIAGGLLGVIIAAGNSGGGGG